MPSTATQPAATQPAAPHPAVKHRSYGNLAIDDAQLIAAAIDRQAWAWPAIVQRYDGLVLSVTWSYRLSAADTAEVLQEVWARLLENLRQIRRPERVAGWISRVTRNECLRLIRRNAREIPTEDDLERGLGNDDDLDTHMLAGERQVALRRAMVGLPERGRALLEALLDQPSLSHRELAVKLDMPLGSVGPTRQRCLTKLRSSMALAVLA